MGFIHLQIEWNPCLGGYSTQIPVLSALYPQLNLLNPPKKFLGTPLTLSTSEYCVLKCLDKFQESFLQNNSGFGGLVVSMLASGTQDRGFKPGRRIFSGVKILSMPFFGREVK
jgi:hypothetical protein